VQGRLEEGHCDREGRRGGGGEVGHGGRSLVGLQERMTGGFRV
jgi:hypothetical protein